MLSSAFKYSELINIFVNFRLSFKEPLTSQDWRLAKILQDFLEISFNAIIFFSGIYYFTSYEFLTYIIQIVEKFSLYRNGETLAPQVHAMEAKWREYQPRLSIIHSIATIFYPRIKLNGVLYLLDKYHEYMLTSSTSDKEIVERYLYDIYSLYDARFGGSRAGVTTSRQASISSSGKHNVLQWIVQ